MADKLNIDAINALPHPLVACLYGGSEWQIHDICVETGLMRIDVCGLLEVKMFADVKDLRDGDGLSHDPDDFYNE
jgi:hypothetical protein